MKFSLIIAPVVASNSPTEVPLLLATNRWLLLSIAMPIGTIELLGVDKVGLDQRSGRRVELDHVVIGPNRCEHMMVVFVQRQALDAVIVVDSTDKSRIDGRPGDRVVNADNSLKDSANVPPTVQT